jgi:hypothetical protein
MGQLVGLRLKLGKAREAAQSYQQLSSRGGKSAASVGVLAKLIRATAAAGDTATAEVLQKELPAAPSTAGLDVGTLEDSSRAVGGGVRRELHRKREATDAGDEEQPKVGGCTCAPALLHVNEFCLHKTCFHLSSCTSMYQHAPA